MSCSRNAGAALVAMLALLGPVREAPGQLPLHPDLKRPTDDPLRVDPLGSKETARAAFEASEATPEQLKKACLEASRRALAAETAVYERGVQQATLNRVLYWRVVVAADEAALDDTPERELHFRLVHWQVAWVAKQIAETKLVAATVRNPERLLAREARLEAERSLVETRSRHDRPDEAAGDALPDYLDSRDVARAQAALADADPGDLARERVKAAREAVRLLFQLERAGVGRVDDRYALIRLLAAERAAAEDEAAEAAVLERHWRWARAAELAEDRHNAVSPFLPTADMQAYRLGLEIELARRQAPREKSDDAFCLPFWSSHHPLDDSAAVIREAPSGDVRALARARAEAVRQTYLARFGSFLAGRGVSDDELLELSGNLLEAERAASDDEAARRAALWRHWARCLYFEEVVASKLVERTTRSLRLANPRRARLTAEIELARPE